MNIVEIKNQLSIRCKNGIGFLLAATIIWSIITFIFLLPLGINEKNIFMLLSSGLMFPLAVIISKAIKAEWKVNDHPLGDLGLYLNIAQLMYFPLLFWVFAKSPEHMVLFFIVITGAHFFPYGWFYHTKAYYIMAPVISIMSMAIGWTMDVERLWILPLAMVFLLLILDVWLYIDYKKKCK